MRETIQKFKFLHNLKKKKAHVIRRRKVCQECGINRVRHHHYLCPICWNKRTQEAVA